MAVRLRGRRQRADKEKRDLEASEPPVVARDELAAELPVSADEGRAMAGEGILSITPANEPAGSEQVADDAATEAGGARAGSASPPEELVPEASLATPTSTAAAMSTATADPEAGEPPSPGASPAVLERPLKAPGSRPGTGGGKDAIPAGLAELGDTDVEAGDYVPRPLPRVMAVANQKGGVGKTTTAVNLGAALAELGYRVLIVDLDPQANATTGVGIDARSFDVSMYDVLMRDEKIEDAVEPTSMKNLFIAPSTIDLAGAEIELVPSFSRELKLRRALEPIADDFDFTLVDCPPSLGLITVNGLAAAAEVLVPIQCEYYALEGLGQLLRNVQLVKSNLNERLELTTIVLTMYDGRTKLAEQVAEEVRSHFGNKVCKNIIPRTVRISEAPSFGQPITAFDPSSRGAIAYRELAREVSGGAS